jgi:hypothetical protein
MTGVQARLGQRRSLVVQVQSGERLVIAPRVQHRVTVQASPVLVQFVRSVGGLAVVRKAGTAISALRLVWELDGEVALLGHDDLAHIDQALGLTLSAGQAGDDVTVLPLGEAEDAGWNWQPGPVWLGLDGMLTQIPPETGALLRIGSALGPQRLYVRLEAPIFQE